jgi:hypothetical protein
MITAELSIDVTEAAGLGEPAHVGVSVVAPDPGALGDNPVIAFARPGAGFTSGYFTERLPGQATSEAAWHAGRGWIFVAVDHLGLGLSSANAPERLTYASLAAAAAAADREVVARLEAGTLDPRLPPVAAPVRLGVGQSMGGCLTVVQQGQHRSFDGIAVLGYGARTTRLPLPPGEPPFVVPWVLRDAPWGDAAIVLNAPEVAAEVLPEGELHPGLKWLDWAFYGDEVDPAAFEDPSRWTTPVNLGIFSTLTTPGVIAQEAAAVRVPVLLAVGERDVIPDVRAEVFAYPSTSDIEIFECPRMAHMHNFAPTAELFWHRIHRWGEWVRDLRLAVLEAGE